jgi:D-lactate dehydrogenase (cytochrome)
VIEAVASGIALARAEYLDSGAVAAVNRAFSASYAETDTLFLEFHGSPAEVADQVERTGAIAANHGGGDFQWALETEARNALWRARHQAGLAAVGLRPGARPWSTDVCVPISRLAECVGETKARLRCEPFPSVVLGHIGDGNFHAVLLIDAEKPEEMTAAEQFNDWLVARAIEMDGTCTGEHGIGLGKRHSLRAELGQAVDVMRSVKDALDPRGLLNPEKIFV